MNFQPGQLVQIKTTIYSERAWGLVREIDHDPDGRRRHLAGVSLVLVRWLHDRDPRLPTSDWMHPMSLKPFEKEPSK
tara:strand:- start:23 stop:253 length:231 start_codon:yes stop_codon:yes gene_type:complete